MKNTKRLLALAVSAAIAAPMSAFATNGMNLEGYGPIATGMGGASMAYDNGTAAMMNNPATLGLMDDGNRFDIALGVLGPDIEASHPAAPVKWKSTADSFMMPALGWVSKSGKLTFGAGGFAQGGMGTEFNAGGPGTAFTAMGMNNAAPVATWREFSEVGVARVLFPVAYNVDSKLTIGGSIDYVRAGMDMQMAMPFGTMGDMMMNPLSTVGRITMTAPFQGMLMGLPTGPNGIYGGYFNFADNNDYTGAAEGDGFAGKLGFTYKMSDKLTIGGTYHSQTELSDLTGTGSMQVAYDDAGGTGDDAVMLVPGKYRVVDFQWPQTFGLGLSYQASDKLMIAADVKQINWSETMDNFRLIFTAPSGDFLDATMYQNWDDQTAFQLGMSYQQSDALTLRAGVNIANNPVPASTLNYLFPAIIEDHYTVGFGYNVSDKSAINFSYTYAPEVAQVGSNLTSNFGLKVTHAQSNYQLMYSHGF